MADSSVKAASGTGTSSAPAAAKDVTSFEGVTARIFPLLASQQRLQMFCDRYLNIAPEIAYFRPAIPFVLFQALNYGRMSSTANTAGWVAQHEFLFQIVIECYERAADGSLRFKDWATVSPFIFVDDTYSVEGGREVYGWPKVLSSIEPESNPWLDDPRLPRKLLRLRTDMFSKLYDGKPLQRHTLLRIEQYDAANTAFQLPPDFSRIVDPIVRGADVTFDTGSTLLRFLGTLVARSVGIGGLSRELVASMTEIALKLRANLTAGGYLDSITLKQFRSSRPESACYQALIRSRMYLDRFNATGLLGQADVLRGDPSGGFRLLIHRYDAYPIVESLGLLHKSEYQGRDVLVTEVVPFSPFWISFDLRYGAGERICWRTPGTPWQSGERESRLTVGRGEGAKNAEALRNGPSDKARTVLASETVPYNTALGPLANPVSGPFDFFDAETKVLPLPISWDRAMAKTAGLRFFLDLIPSLAQFDKAGKDAAATKIKSVHAEPFPCYEHDWADGVAKASSAFLTITRFGEMSSAANNVGWWSKNSVQLSILVKVSFCDKPPKEGSGEAQGKVLFTKYLVYPLFDFADSPIAVTTGREVRGLPTVEATIDGGSDAWIADPLLAQRVASVSTDIFPAMNLGQTIRKSTLIEVWQAAVGSLERPPKKNRITDALASIGPDLAKGVSLEYIAYKNYPAADDQSYHAYTGFVGWQSVFKRLLKPAKDRVPVQVDPLIGPLEVAILKEPNYEITSDLGLLFDRIEVRDGSALYYMCPCLSPFRVRGDVYTPLPEDLFWQAVHQWPLRVMEGAWKHLTNRTPPIPGALVLDDVIRRLKWQA